MKRSNKRILTTHTGSLPRTAKVVELLLAEQKNPGARKAELDAAVREEKRLADGFGVSEPPRAICPCLTHN